jgi:hypothetical protein
VFDRDFDCSDDLRHAPLFCRCRRHQLGIHLERVRIPLFVARLVKLGWRVISGHTRSLSFRPGLAAGLPGLLFLGGQSLRKSIAKDRLDQLLAEYPLESVDLVITRFIPFADQTREPSFADPQSAGAGRLASEFPDHCRL